MRAMRTCLSFILSTKKNVSKKSTNLLKKKCQPTWTMIRASGSVAE